MIDTCFSVKGMTLTYKGRQYQMVEAGIRNDKPYATLRPQNKAVEGIIIAQIKKCIPCPFSPDEVQQALNEA
ncbi:MAG: hypothetical protein BWY95_01702 [Bacteroidetes bacterium ADurb.BinA104]|nr:MAG: hypothetical protein BWY95_01702 [Bacteroidetes bacterium ADurb.BinA104]